VFFGTTFKIKPFSALAVEGEVRASAVEEDGGEATEEYVLSCVGTGFVNISKRT
jgi:hypothetical protein